MEYRYASAATLDHKPKVGDGSCVPLVRHYVPNLSNHRMWREGENVMATKATILPGTAIATFEHGRYPNRPHGNHAAFFIRYQLGPGGAREGIWIADQYANTPRIRVRKIVPRGQRKDGTYIGASDNASAFSVIK